MRRVERYLTIAWDSNAKPVIVLTKSDLCKEIPEKLKELESVSLGVDTIMCSSISEDGYGEVNKFPERGKTIAFIGSSGVGKSTLINRLLGKELMVTKDIREDDGTLAVERLDSYQKLQREMSYEGLTSRQLENEKIRTMFGGSKKKIKQFKQHLKGKKKV